MKSEKGFTLIEIVVAMVILGLAYVAVLQNFSISMKNINRVERSRTKVLEEVLEFDTLVNSDEDDQAEADELADYPVFLEGGIFELLQVTSPDSTLVTLKLIKK